MLSIRTYFDEATRILLSISNSWTEQREKLQVAKVCLHFSEAEDENGHDHELQGKQRNHVESWWTYNFKIQGAPGISLPKGVQCYFSVYNNVAEDRLAEVQMSKWYDIL